MLSPQDHDTGLLGPQSGTIFRGFGFIERLILFIQPEEYAGPKISLLALENRI